jgi:hypothetical protein
MNDVKGIVGTGNTFNDVAKLESDVLGDIFSLLVPGWSQVYTEKRRSGKFLSHFNHPAFSG